MVAAHQAGLLQKQAFLSLKTTPGKYSTQLASTPYMFAGLTFQNELRGAVRIKRDQLLQSIVDNLETKMFTTISSKKQHKKRISTYDLI